MTSQTTYKNTYKASAPVITQNIHLDTPPEEYDFNYCGEIKVLRSDRVELRPYVVRSRTRCTDTARTSPVCHTD